MSRGRRWLTEMEGGHMDISGLNAANQNMAAMIQILLSSLRTPTELAEKAIAVDLENQSAAEKMDVA